MPDSRGRDLRRGRLGAAGVYVATERNSAASGTSRPSILRYDVGAVPGATSLDATHEWNLAADFPGHRRQPGPRGHHLRARLLLDRSRASSTRAPRRPTTRRRYADHGGGLFLVGVEATGHVYAYALDHTSGALPRGSSTSPAASPWSPTCTWEPSTQRLWVVCDEACNGRIATFEVNGAGALAPTTYYERPSGMPNITNEGFTLTPGSACVGGLKPVFWADDANTGATPCARGR